MSRKNGKAHHRNRLRRLYREAFRLSRHELPVGLDLVLIPRKSEAPPLEPLKASLVKLVRLSIYIFMGAHFGSIIRALLTR